jgi:hypothetical protein
MMGEEAARQQLRARWPVLVLSRRVGCTGSWLDA